MSLTWSEVEQAGLYAYNHTRAHHDECGMDWEHWHAYPFEGDVCVATDGHSHSPQVYQPWPDEGWVHKEGCTCELFPRCQVGVRRHNRVKVIYGD